MSATLKSRLRHENPSIGSKLSDDCAKGKDVRLVDSPIPVLALNNPQKVEPNVACSNDNVDLVCCPDSLQVHVGISIQTDTAEEGCDFLLILRPRRHPDIVVHYTPPIGNQSPDDAADLAMVGVKSSDFAQDRIDPFIASGRVSLKNQPIQNAELSMTSVRGAMS